MKNEKLEQKVEKWQEFLVRKYPNYNSCPLANHEAIFWEYALTLPEGFTDYESVGVPNWIYEEALFKSIVGERHR